MENYAFYKLFKRSDYILWQPFELTKLHLVSDGAPFCRHVKIMAFFDSPNVTFRVCNAAEGTRAQKEPVNTYDVTMPFTELFDIVESYQRPHYFTTCKTFPEPHLQVSKYEWINGNIWDAIIKELDI